MRVGPDAGDGPPLPALQVAWESALEVAGQPPSPSWKWTSAMPRRLLSSGGAAADSAYRHLAASQVEAFATDLATALGLGSAAQAVKLEPTAGAAPGSTKQ